MTYEWLVSGLVMFYEGLRLRPYRDSAGHWTVGWGHMLPGEGPDWRIHLAEGGPVTVYRDREISLLDAQRLLAEDLTTRGESIDRMTEDRPLNGPQKAALVSLAYNVGEGAVKRSRLLRRWRAGEQPVAVAEEFLGWNKAGGEVLTGLVYRRAAERFLFTLPELQVDLPKFAVFVGGANEEPIQKSLQVPNTLAITVVPVGSGDVRRAGAEAGAEGNGEGEHLDPVPPA